MRVLKLDISGIPEAWITPEDAAAYYATESVAYTLGDPMLALRGGTNRHGQQSRIEIHPILAVNGASAAGVLLAATPRLTRFNHKLFARDRHLCAYCGASYAAEQLTREHVVPLAQGGEDRWMNVVTACRSCNQRKANRTPEQARMPLLYLPYVPCRWEDMILQARNGSILADQMAFLRSGLPARSRLN
ncbi:HNH endonuclease [Piscinibacterium candidicorallinum]|uniref:HNH endonuclease n=1 Tax=Piscinibacterium candidicorallinum TaxID=1793872 RepID=A0ABV7H986_9BURK